MNRKIILLAIMLAGASGPSASAQSQSVALPAGAIFKDVKLTWEGRRLIFYATFRRDGNELPLYLEWRHTAAQAPEGRNEIDVIEQYGREMPIAVTLISLEKNPAGQAVLYMGRPAPNTPKMEGDDALNMTGRVVLTDATGQTDEYAFSLSPSAAGALPRIAGAPR